MAELIFSGRMCDRPRHRVPTHLSSKFVCAPNSPARDGAKIANFKFEDGALAFETFSYVPGRTTNGVRALGGHIYDRDCSHSQNSTTHVAITQLRRRPPPNTAAATMTTHNEQYKRLHWVLPFAEDDGNYCWWPAALYDSLHEIVAYEVPEGEICMQLLVWLTFCHAVHKKCLTMKCLTVCTCSS